MTETSELLEIKEKIDTAKSQKSEVDGQIKTVQEQMQKEFGATDLKSSKEKLKKIGEELDKKEADFESGMSELRKELNEVDQ